MAGHLVEMWVVWMVVKLVALKVATKVVKLAETLADKTAEPLVVLWVERWAAYLVGK